MALAEYFYGKHSLTSPSPQDMMFHARFDEPELNILCNHDALFKIKIKDGHYNTDYSRSAEMPVANP